MIPEDVLNKYNCIVKAYEKADFIYRENTECTHYFQVVSGKVKLSNFSEEGKEFIQHIFEQGQCFGEALLFINEKYPANAVALSSCNIIKLSKENFFRLLQQYPQYSLEINRNLSQRLYYKMLMSQNLFSKDPEIRLDALLKYFKHTHSCGSPALYPVPLTRQQLADLTGLRVETVIRTIKLMEKNKLLVIKKGKIYF